MEVIEFDSAEAMEAFRRTLKEDGEIQRIITWKGDEYDEYKLNGKRYTVRRRLGKVLEILRESGR